MGQKMYLYKIKFSKRKNNAIFKGKKEKQSQAHSHFQLLLQKSQVQENHRGERNPLVEGTVNSIAQKSYGFVPITSKNTPSLQYMHILKMRDKADTCFVLIHHRSPVFVALLCCYRKNNNQEIINRKLYFLTFSADSTGLFLEEHI
jgi:hypothetical protein